MKFLSAAWEQIYGLLVEDGQIAIGTLLAFVGTAIYAYLVGDELRNSAGWLLFTLLMALLLVNLYTTGRKAYAARTRH
jgi:hypothetical protein